MLDSFKGVAIEDEARLTDSSIREHFLSRIFASADLDVVADKGTMEGLVDFHTRNKYLIMATSPKALSDLGRIVANHDRLAPARAIAAYSGAFRLAMAQPPRYKTRINALMHVLGYVSKGLRPKDRAHFLAELERYRKGRVPFSVPLATMASFVVRFAEAYLSRQTLFEPYPEALVLATDFGKGRKR